MISSLTEGRSDRFHNELITPDQRKPFQRDRDRILHSSAFRRLAGVTQVVGVAEGHHYHNRLTHTLKVGQIARRLAEYLCDEYKELANYYGLEPEVVEAAALAHDIGHPPFGHIAEEELCNLIDKEWGEGSNPGGFEGNAQSFRIVCNLALRTTKYDGLNLSRATLAAILKYPWARDSSVKKKVRKWGAYETELHELKFAREYYRDEYKSLEAEIMDWADDIAYSIFDLDDFWRAGLIPLGTIVGQDLLLKKFIDDNVDLWWDDEIQSSSEDRREFEERIKELVFNMPLEMKNPYDGSAKQRASVRNWCSRMIARYIRDAIELREVKEGERRLSIQKNAVQEVNFLKSLTRRYVILNPSLSAQQYGQRKIIKSLFEYLLDIVSDNKKKTVLPVRWQEFVAKIENDKIEGDKSNLRLRLVADIISEMTEQEAIRMDKRLSGDEPGSVLEPIIM